jgi:hypothetical protein
MLAIDTAVISAIQPLIELQKLFILSQAKNISEFYMDNSTLSNIVIASLPVFLTFGCVFHSHMKRHPHSNDSCLKIGQNNSLGNVSSPNRRDNNSYVRHMENQPLPEPQNYEEARQMNITTQSCSEHSNCDLSALESHGLASRRPR